MARPIPYGRQEITEEDIKAVEETLKSDFLTQGPKIKIFEDAFSKYIGSKYAVAVSNGTAALHLSAMALGVNEKSEVLTAPITFAASANAVLYCGGKVDFVDIDPATALIDFNQVEDKLKKNPNRYSGIIPIDFAGNPLDLSELRQIVDKYGLWILEDSCHAPGAEFMDKGGNFHASGSGEFSDLSIFSFHPVKHIACGEGGMITTNNFEHYNNLIRYRTHGITKDPDLMKENHGGWYYEMMDLGFNYRLTDIQAALGISQLKRADAGLVKRREIASKYDTAFEESPIVTLKTNDGARHAYHLYVILVKDRLGLYNHLRDSSIFAQVHYIPVHLLPYYKQYGWKKGDFPHAEDYYEKCLSLPIFPQLTEYEQALVIEKVTDYCK